MELVSSFPLHKTTLSTLSDLIANKSPIFTSTKSLNGPLPVLIFGVYSILKNNSIESVETVSEYYNESWEGFELGTYLWRLRPSHVSRVLCLFYKQLMGHLYFCGQSYKHFTLVNYDSRVAITSKLLILTTLDRVVFYEHRGFIRLATVYIMWLNSASKWCPNSQVHEL